MRYIAIFLLLANISYFFWLRYGAVPSVTVVREEQRALLNSGLTLISEYEAQIAARPVLKCFRLSGFITTEDASSFIAELGDAAFAADVGLGGEPLSSHYRVFIPPLSSRGVATITLDSLSESLGGTEMDIDIYLITRGVLENGIALGVFADRDSALAVQNAVQELGYGPAIEEIPRSTGEIAVQLQLLERYVMENPAWLDSTVDRPNLSITENLCETIAQGTQFP